MRDVSPSEGHPVPASVTACRMGPPEYVQESAPPRRLTTDRVIESGSISGGKNHGSGTTHTSGHKAESSRSLGPSMTSSRSQPGASPPTPSPTATSLRSCQEGPSLLIVTPCPPGPATSIWTCPLPSPLPGAGGAPARTRGEVTVPTTVPGPCFPGPHFPSGLCQSSVSG